MVDASNLINMEIRTNLTQNWGSQTKPNYANQHHPQNMLWYLGKCNGTNFFFHFCKVDNGATSKVQLVLLWLVARCL